MRITIIGILSILLGLILLFPSLGFFGLGDLIKTTGLTFNNGPLALTTLGIAVANFVLGLGCLAGWRPVWFYLIIVSVINLVVAMIALLNTAVLNADLNQLWAVLISAVWFGLAVLVLRSMLTNKTKEWFHI